MTIAWAIAGFVVICVSEAATLAQIEPFYSWNTPIAWTGFILFADSLVYRRRQRSWLRSSPAEFVFLAAASIPLWLVFEFYNLYIDNWYYVGLPDNRLLRLFGYAWSFATIWPAIFEAADLIDSWRDSPRVPTVATQVFRAREFDGRLSLLSFVVGMAALTWPLLWPSRYLAAPVWLGFIFLLEPLNHRLGGATLYADAIRGHYARLINLSLSGALCGILWEFWNYWSRAKWHYTVPILEELKIFEMPLPGYLGFPAFALECFTMYVFLRAVTVKAAPALRERFRYPIAATPLSFRRSG
jgi:hypothetical protein